MFPYSYIKPIFITLRGDLIGQILYLLPNDHEFESS